jgi:hypothetical protein
MKQQKSPVFEDRPRQDAIRSLCTAADRRYAGLLQERFQLYVQVMYVFYYPSRNELKIGTTTLDKLSKRRRQIRLDDEDEDESVLVRLIRVPNRAFEEEFQKYVRTNILMNKKHLARREDIRGTKRQIFLRPTRSLRLLEAFLWSKRHVFERFVPEEIENLRRQDLETIWAELFHQRWRALQSG